VVHDRLVVVVVVVVVVVAVDREIA